MIDQQVIDLLTLLKPEIDKAMGEWQDGDKAYRERAGIGIYINRGYDEIIFKSGSIYLPDDLELIRIPPPLPLPGQEAGRTLWEMVEGTDRKVKLTHTTDGLYVVSVLVPAQGITTCEADTPYLALLKAFARQHGKEV